MPLKDEIEKAAKEQYGEDAIVTDYVLVAHVATLNSPGNVSFYFTDRSGPIHSVMGLMKFGLEEIKQENFEYAGDDNDE